MKMNLKRIASISLIFLLAGLVLFIHTPSSVRRRPENVNVILLTVDSIRQDHLGCYGYKRMTSPNIDGIARNGGLFHRAFSQSAWTMPGIMSILTSLQPPVHGIDHRGAMPNPAVKTLLDCFREAGYVVPNICFLLSVPELSTIHAGPPEEKYFSEEDDEELLRWLDENQESKFFVWYHHRGPHLPYRVREGLRSMFLPTFPPEGMLTSGMRAVLSDAAVVPVGTAEFGATDLPLLIGLYDAEMKALDNFVGKLMSRLRKYDLLENTLIVITGDHGEELLDHGFVGHASTMRAVTLYDEVIRIPLIFSLPGYLPRGSEIDEQVQQVDIMPTILDVAGLPIPSGVQGRSLAPFLLDSKEEAGSSPPIFVESVYGGYQATEEMARTYWRCIRTDAWKLIEMEGPEGKSYQLYDLLLDPRELKDVYAEDAAPVPFLKELLAGMINQNEVRRRTIDRRATATASTDGQAVCPEFLFPYEGVVLRYPERGGIVRAAWTGQSDSTYIVEYDVGEGIHHLSGSFAVIGDKRDYGPYAEEMWSALAVRNPWRIRISPDVQPRCWSEWIEFSFE